MKNKTKIVKQKNKDKFLRCHPHRELIQNEIKMYLSVPWILLILAESSIVAQVTKVLSNSY
jgi:hypothetical protein